MHRNVFVAAIILLIVIIILILLYLITQPVESFTSNTNNTNNNTNNTHNPKPYCWVYWENINNKKIPPYIELCLETIKKHCPNSFNLVILDNHTIHNYLPELKTKEKQYNLNSLRIAHRVDYYRLLLLQKHGGFYLDADIVVMKDPKEIADKLNTYDFVGFGCTGNRCRNGYGYPSNWALASKKDGQLMNECVRLIEGKLKQISDDTNINKNKNKNYNYHEFGKLLIWQGLRNLEKQKNYKYYHYPSDVDGARDADGKWMTNDVFFSAQPINYEDPAKLIFVVLYNSGMSNYENLSREHLLTSNLNISKFFRRSLNGTD